MRRRLFILQCLILAAGHTLQVPGMPRSADSLSVRNVRPGVTHSLILKDEGPWVIHVVQMDLTRRDLRLAAVKALDRLKGREPTSAMARRSRDSLTEVLAAINADFFSPEGEPAGQMVIDGTVVRARLLRGAAERNARSHFGVNASGRPFISRVAFSGVVVFVDGSARRIARVNSGQERSSCSVFNAYFGPSTPPDSLKADRREYALVAAGTRRDTALYVAADTGRVGGDTPVPPGGIVLSCEGDSVSRPVSPVTPGDTVRVVLSFTPLEVAAETLVGGGPRIVVDGKSVAGTEEHREGTAPDFSARRHPRSGIGFSADTTVLSFVTVDGRQESSAGMSLLEFADLMLSLGIAQGMNLDGGGSTTMVVEGEVVNSPSDAAGERPVANCLILLGRKQ